MARTLELRSVPAYASNWLIVNVVSNPKRPSTACYDRFALFAEGMTVADFGKACGKGFRSEIDWCAKRGYIALLNPAEVEAAPVAEPVAEAEAMTEALEAEAEVVAELVPAEAEAAE